LCITNLLAGLPGHRTSSTIPFDNNRAPVAPLEWAPTAQIDLGAGNAPLDMTRHGSEPWRRAPVALSARSPGSSQACNAIEQPTVFTRVGWLAVRARTYVNSGLRPAARRVLNVTKTRLVLLAPGAKPDRTAEERSSSLAPIARQRTPVGQSK